MQLKQKGTHEEWQIIAEVTIHDLRHDFAHRARAAGWSLEEIAVYAVIRPKMARLPLPPLCAIRCRAGRR